MVTGGLVVVVVVVVVDEIEIGGTVLDASAVLLDSMGDDNVLVTCPIGVVPDTGSSIELYTEAPHTAEFAGHMRLPL